MSDDTSAPSTDEGISAALRKLYAATLMQTEAVVDLHVAMGIEPPLDPPPSRKPKPGKVATVNGKAVQLMQAGLHVDCKGASQQEALSTIDRLSEALWKPGLKPGLIGFFMGIDNIAHIRPGAAIAEGLPGALAKRGQACVWSLPINDVANSRGPDRFKRIIDGQFDDDLLAFAGWIDGTNAWVRIAWEKASHFFPHSISSRTGYHYDFGQATKAYNHAMDVIVSKARDVRFSDDEFRTAFQGNGKKPRNLIDPALCALDPSRCHQRGIDIYPGDFSGGSWENWFSEDRGPYPSSLDGWAKHVKERDQVFSIGEFGVMGRMDTNFLYGMFEHIKDLSTTQPVGYLMYFHQADSKLVGQPGQEDNVAAFKATFGSLE